MLTGLVSKKPPSRTSAERLAARSSIAILTVVAAALPISGALGAEAIRLESFKTHTRLHLDVDDNVPIEFKDRGAKFEIFLKGIGAADLGAPLGNEAKWAERYKSLTDPRLSAL